MNFISANLTTLQEHTGTVSNPSKMPCHSTSIPAEECNIGSFLRTVEDSTCADCYACKGRYIFGNVQTALYNRLDKIRGKFWVEAMAEMIQRKSGKVGVFRWFDSGDLQNAKHLRDIVAIANATPEIDHWLPTRECKLVINYLVNVGPFPANLTVRVSAPMIGSLENNRIHADKRVQKIMSDFWTCVELGVPVSTVGDENPDSQCPAPTQGGKCLDCRKCWNKLIPVQNYVRH